MSDSRRLPARVYWVRRFVVLGIPLIIIAVVVWLFVRPDSGEDPAAQGGTSSAPVAPETSETPTDTDGVGDCAPASLALAMAADATSFAPGVSATFTVTVTNTGEQPCLVDAGEAQREIVITSGSDRVWSNRDCIAPGTETRTLLLAGGGTDSTPFAWNRIRSAEGCPADLPVPGAGTYSAQLNLAGVSAPAVVFGLE
ncbi:hypothetical protein [Cellulomonas sp. Leaf334]|uniref:hypothetical protein n=1 Tax=Cellulomonas sp. Leaf334 TaxID=1736339 RepID=UPI0006F7241B|nr:hypothetical protein [Cellulomonas sp. Leaf334]KQR11881.1 hypothetical protein ASF78_11795 [Cellulomonas sp. Leaf334]